METKQAAPRELTSAIIYKKKDGWYVSINFFEPSGKYENQENDRGLTFKGAINHLEKHFKKYKKEYSNISVTGKNFSMTVN